MRIAPTLLTLCLGYVMVIVDATAVNVALPDLQRDLATSVTGLQWVVDAYVLAFAALLLTGGALGDRLGGRRVLYAGLGLFTVASLGCGLAPSTPALVTARAVQGVGAALTVPASLSLIRAAYPDRAARARAVGVWGAVAGIGAASGPIVAGLLIAASGWRAVFFINVPIGLLAAELCARYVPSPAGHRRGLDLAGQALAFASLAALTLALIDLGAPAAPTAVVVAGFVSFAAATAGFVAVERRSRSPMVPLELFSSSAFSGGSAVGLLINLGFYGQLFVINLYFQQVRGASALGAGLAILPEAGLLTVASVVAGRLAARAGPRLPMLTGLLLGAAGLAGLALAGRDTSYALLVPPMVAAGFGMAMTMPAATTAVIEAAPGDRSGIASGVVNAARQAGGVVGVALLGTLVAGTGFVGRLHVALAVAAGAFVLAAVVTAAAVGRQRPLRRSQSETLSLASANESPAFESMSPASRKNARNRSV
jgi:MFS transporter, DHA2 family, methylenomycin A resistance protein